MCIRDRAGDVRYALCEQAARAGFRRRERFTRRAQRIDDERLEMIADLTENSNPTAAPENVDAVRGDHRALELREIRHGVVLQDVYKRQV